jgi:hypothetical protein
MSDEVPLGGGWSVDGVVRVGDTVRRPQTHATQLMRDVLVHLAEVAVDYAKRRECERFTQNGWPTTF